VFEPLDLIIEVTAIEILSAMNGMSQLRRGHNKTMRRTWDYRVTVPIAQRYASKVKLKPIARRLLESKSISNCTLVRRTEWELKRHGEAKSQAHGTGFQDCEQKSDYGIKNERQTYYERDGNQLHCVGKA
jgi:hypothetical protein